MLYKLYHHIGFIRFILNLCKFKNLHIHPSTTIGFKGQISLPQSLKTSQGCRLEMDANSKLTLGENVLLCQRVHIYPQSGSISIAANTSLQDDCRIYGQVAIGANCLFAPNVFVASSAHIFLQEPNTPINYQESKFSPPQKPVSIGDDCWIGINVYVAPGVTIGSGCIIGANSSVTKDIPPYSIAVGSPAKVIKQRINFAPPSMVEAQQKKSWPYYYLGFVKKDDEVISQENFVLCLKHENESYKNLRIDFTSKSEGFLQHANEVYKFASGLNSLTFKTNEDGPFFNFISSTTLKHMRAELK